MSEEDRDRLAKFSDEDISAMMDMVRMYRSGRAAICKAILYAVVGAVVTAIGMGVKHYLATLINN